MSISVSVSLAVSMAVSVSESVSDFVSVGVSVVSVCGRVLGFPSVPLRIRVRVPAWP